MLQRWLIMTLTLLCGAVVHASSGTDKVLANVRVAPGFKIELYTDQVDGARSLTLGKNGTVYVGTGRPGAVYAVMPGEKGAKPTVRTLASGLKRPNGVAYRDGALYVAETPRILRLDNVDTAAGKLEPQVVRDDLPRDGHHGARYIAFGPDDKLYVGIGAPCNVCNEPNYGLILRMNADGSDREVFARGVRNAVGLAWHPQTQELWFTDNGRDYLGDDTPPDELNRAPRADLNFGFPFCHGADIKDPEFGGLGDCNQSVPPARALGPHVAALGLRFYTGRNFPVQYRGQIFLAEHGSWNRSVKSGYRVMRLKLEGDKVVSYEPFVSGFHRDDDVFGRPVDVLQLDDGSLLISDDLNGAIYRITYANAS